MTKGTILIAGSLAQRPGIGGHVWVFLQWLLGFRRLGFDVIFLDWLDQPMCTDDAGKPCRVEDSKQLRQFVRVMEEHGLGGAFSLNFDQGKKTFGLPRKIVIERAKSAAFLLNVMGFLGDFEILAAVPQRVFLDIDPGFGQMWQELGLAAVFGGHHRYVTIGENIGRADCDVPTCGLDWITTPHPVVLDRWPVAGEKPRHGFTSIASWRGPFGPVEYHGKTYGLRVHEFRKFAQLPKLSHAEFDLALDIHPVEEKDIALLRDNGWTLLDPAAAAGDPSGYREFVRGSKAEVMIAKHLYVETRGGWFSDRSICYLASGRPVLAQDTGFSRNYPTGRGLIAFSTLEEAVAGVKEINANYETHRRAARDIAAEFFDSDKVLRRLLDALCRT